MFMPNLLSKRTYTLSLNGEWQLAYADVGAGDPENLSFDLTCPVPGDVHDAFIAAGIIKDPLYNQNNLDCKWLEDKEFWLRRSFTLPENYSLDHVILRFDGLDLSADIRLNGRAVGSAFNAFVEHEFDVTPLLHPGENLLLVRLDMGLHAVKDKPLLDMHKMWDNGQPYRVFMRKPQYVYGWDWTLWLPSCGIWRDVSLISVPAAHITDAHVRTLIGDSQLSAGGEAELQILAEAEIFVADQGGDLHFAVSLFPDEVYDGWQAPIVSMSQPVNNGKFDLRLSNVKLWQPNGWGDPYLYRVEIALYDGEILLDNRVLRHGIRSVAIDETPLNETEKSFTFVINGNKIFAKGANHVPPDCLPGRVTAQRSAELIRLAQECHMNMLRVWGGGVYESEAFMDECDRRGIMVWHDFMFACGFYPDHDADFMANINREARLAVKRLRRHSSLIGWSGNNEIGDMYRGVSAQHPGIKYYGKPIFFDMLPKIVEELMPGAIYRPESPHGGVESNADEEGDQHVWKFTHRNDYPHPGDLWRFTDYNYKFLSEFGLLGALNYESALLCMSPEYLNITDPVWLHHNNKFSILAAKLVEKYFKCNPQNLPIREFILKSQVIQAEITRHIYDEFRARKFVCSGLLFWTLGDSFGVTNWAILDYYLSKRPVYQYLRRSMSPINVMIRGFDVQTDSGEIEYAEHFADNPEPLQIWAVNDRLEAEWIALEYSVMSFAGEVLSDETLIAELPANSALKLAEVDVSLLKDMGFTPETCFLYAKISVRGEVICDNKYLFAPYAKLRIPQPHIITSFKQGESGTDSTIATFTSESFVWMLHLPEDPENGRIKYSDNNFDLIPNLSKTITIKGGWGSHLPDNMMYVMPGDK
jgi:beta-mannosidase